MGAKKGGIRFGSYYPVNSLIHRLDPRAKILAMLIFMLGIFMVNKFWVFGLVYLFGFIMLALAHIPPGKALNSVRGLLVLLLFTSLINMFFTPGEQILWQYGPLHLTMEGLLRSGLMLLRLVALIAFSGLLTFTTTPIELADALESLLKPFQRLGMPVHEFAMMMTIALRFIPVLLEEADKIVKAQRSRGADFSSGSLKRRLNSIIAVIVPLLYNALKRADDLAIAMEARAYIGGEGRVSLRELQWRLTDGLALATVLLFVVFLFVSHWLKWGI